MSDQYCGRDAGCKPACHTYECTRAMCRELVNAPGYVPLHKRIENYETTIATLKARVEELETELEMLKLNGAY